MPRGNPARKLAITVDADVHARVVRAARKSKVSLSAWFTEAARQSLRIADGLAAVAEWEAQHGAFSAAELAAAGREIRRKHLSKPTRRSRAR